VSTTPNRASAAVCCRGHTEILAKFDVETNKAIALRLAQIFNDRRFDLLEDVLHPQFRERGLSGFPPTGTEVGPGGRRKLYSALLDA
jgi:hypothetical protein